MQIQGSVADNSVSVSQLPDGRVLVSDSREGIPAGAGCVTASGGVACSGASRIFVGLSQGNDSLATTASLPIQYFGGDGDDALVTGTGPGPSRVEFTGNAGRDMVNYAAATRGVAVTVDGAANDGRTGSDADNIDDDVERLQGSQFADSLSGNFFDSIPTTFIGLGGDDALNGGSGNDVFTMSGQADGADLIRGLGGFDTVDYRNRSRSVTVTVDAGSGDDGEGGERDEVREIEQVITGSGADTLTGSPFPGSGGHNFVSGAGADRITGTITRDGISPGPGRDTVDARGGDDSVRARDGEADSIACGTGIDTLQADSGLEISTGCETLQSVGVLGLAPKALDAEAGEVVRVRLSWRHPRASQRLRSVTLQLRDGDAPVGEVAISPRAGGMSAEGAVELVRSASRLRRSGTTVRARLGLRLDESLAGRRLILDVEASDLRGRRQIERGAGTIRVGA